MFGLKLYIALRKISCLGFFLSVCVTLSPKFGKKGYRRLTVSNGIVPSHFHLFYNYSSSTVRQVEESGWAVMYVDTVDTKFDFELLIHLQLYKRLFVSFLGIIKLVLSQLSKMFY